MGKFCQQGAREWDLGNGVKAPIGDRGGAAVLKEAQGKTVGIVGDAGIAPGGLPVGKGNK